VELDPASGELILVVNTALMGEWSALNRFSYQVVVTVVRVGAAITGSSGNGVQPRVAVPS